MKTVSTGMGAMGKKLGKKGEQLFKPIIYTESHVIAEHTTPQMEIPCSPVRGSHIVQTKNVSLFQKVII